jgi:hypothetical protein
LVKAGEWQSITGLARRFVRSRDDILLAGR